MNYYVFLFIFAVMLALWQWMKTRKLHQRLLDQEHANRNLRDRTEALQEELQHKQFILDHLPITLLEIDEQHHVRFHNRPAQSTLGDLLQKLREQPVENHLMFEPLPFWSRPNPDQDEDYAAVGMTEQFISGYLKLNHHGKIPVQWSLTRYFNPAKTQASLLYCFFPDRHYPNLVNNINHLSLQWRALNKAFAGIILLLNPEGSILECVGQHPVWHDLFQHLQGQATLQNLLPETAATQLLQGLFDCATQQLPQSVHFEMNLETSTRYFTAQLVACGGRVLAVVQEETELCKLKRELTSVEQQWRPLVEQAPDIILTTNREGVIQYINHTVILTPEEVVGTNIYDYIHEDNHELVRSSIDFVFETGRSTKYEIKSLSANQEEVWYQSRVGPIMDDDKVRQACIISRDITQRVISDRELRAKETLLAEAQRIAQIGSFELDLTTNQVKCSPETFRICAVDPAEFDGQMQTLFFTHAHQQDRSLVRSMFAKSLAQRHFHSFEYHLSNPQGIEKTLFIQGNYNFSKDGSPNRLVGIVQDVTDRNMVETTLKKETKFISAVLNTTSTLVVVLDLEGRIIRVNNTCLELTGYQMSEFINRKVWDFLIPAEEIERVKQVFNDLKTGHFPNHFEGRWLAKDGSKRMISWHNSVILDDLQRVEYVIGTGVDVTPLKTAEQERTLLETQIRRGQKLEAIGTLAGGIAHDFNNLLFAIMLNLDLAKGGMTGSDRHLRFIDRAMEAGRRAKDLVKQILTFSRQTDQVPEPIDLVPVLKESMRLMRSTLPTTIEIRHDFGSFKPMIMSDPTSLHQILMNLCTNAEYAMRENGGELKVTLSQETLEAQQAQRWQLTPGSYARIRVKDQGHGIHPNIQTRIFDPFFTTKPAGEGTGMGLAVVHGIVHDHGGTIQCHSQPGQGTTFDVYLPVIKDKEDIIRKKLPGKLPTGNEHILLVDDDESVLEVSREILQRLGYRVTAMANPVEALDKFLANPQQFDLIITDQTMPKLTGDRLAKDAMKVRPDLPVILVTGFSHQVDEQTVAAIGVRAFLLKPVLYHELAETIRMVLEGKRNLS